MQIKQKGQNISVDSADNDMNLEQVIAMLDGFAASDASRLKIDISDEYEQGEVKRQYHHGRCDIGSPWARGCAFDVLEDEREN
ncbi:MAG: hypothetical protein J1E98_07415 [Lachnospiraceae bacterium]|nr:hypothetical protein [Lachnospiraceae bacterium]